MPKKDDFIMIGLVAAGVMLAGFIMNQFSDVGVVDDARSGFGG